MIPPPPSSSPPPSISPSFSNVLMERIFLDIPPLTPDSSVISIPVSPRGISSPTNSVEFLEKIPPLPPISYFCIQESDTFESLIRQFLRTTACILDEIFIIDPHYFDLHEIRHGISQPPRSGIYSGFRQSIFSSGGILFQSFSSFLRYYL